MSRPEIVLPEVTIGEDATDHVDEVVFDSERYVHYLRSRNVSDEHINRLDLVITDLGSAATSAGSYEPPFLNADKRHTIRFSARHTPGETTKQGRNLRHETEHFIWGTRSTAKVHAAARLAVGFSFSGYGAYAVGKYGFDATGPALQLPTVPEVVPDTLGGVLGGMVGAYGSWQIFTNFLVHLDPEELVARRAARKYKEALPDGTLEIKFRDPA